MAADGGKGRLDRILEGLARPRRRRVLYALAEEQPQEIEELTAAVVEYETDGEPADADREAVEAMLYHNALPKLATLGLVDYDPRSGSVCFRNPPPELEEFLILCRELDTETGEGR